MPKESVVFALAPVYAAKGIGFHPARAVTILPEGDEESARGAVDIVHTNPDRAGEQERIRYDHLVNATGPQLRFDLTPGLGPDGGHTVSVCTAEHAVQASARLDETIELLRAGGRRPSSWVWARHLHLRGCGLRVRRQRRPRAARGGCARPVPAGLPHQRGPAR